MQFFLQFLKPLYYEPSADEEANDPVRKFLHGIAQDATLLLRDRWDSEGAVIPVETLQIYCQLSETLDPLPPMPRLVPTWDCYWTAAHKELAFDPAKNALNTYFIGKWIDLIKCISGSEPRMLAQQKFPDCSMREVQQFLETTEVYREGEVDLSTRNDYESEIEILSDLKIINRLGEIIPSIKEEVAMLSSSIDSRRSRLEEDLGELFPEPDYDNSELRPSGGIGIEEILSDL